MCKIQRSTHLVIGFIFHFRSYHYTEELYKGHAGSPQLCKVHNDNPQWEGSLSGRSFTCNTGHPPTLPTSLSPSSKSTYKFSSYQSSWENKHRVCCVTQAQVVSWFPQRGRWPAFCHTGSQVIRVLTAEEHRTLVIKDHVITVRPTALWDDEIYCGFVGFLWERPRLLRTLCLDQCLPHLTQGGHPSLLLWKLSHCVCVHVGLCILLHVYVGMCISGFQVSVCPSVFCGPDTFQ